MSCFQTNKSLQMALACVLLGCLYNLRLDPYDEPLPWFMIKSSILSLARSCDKNYTLCGNIYLWYLHYIDIRRDYNIMCFYS